MFRYLWDQLPPVFSGSEKVPAPYQTRNALARIIGSVASSSERLKLSNAIRDGELIPDKCYLPGWIQNPLVLNKDSASATSVVLAQAQPRVDKLQSGVSLKIAFDEVDASPDNSLSIERALYDIYFDYILRNHFTPNIVTYVASFECSTSELKKSMKDDAALRKLAGKDQLLDPMQIRLRKDYGELYDWENVHVLVLERTLGYTLSDYTRKKRTTTEWRSVLFQIIYTFEVFNRLGLRHNDGHLGNIFIDTYAPEEEMTTFYAIDNKTLFRVPLTRFVKLFDLDMGSSHCDQTYINPAYQSLIDETRRRGMCANTKLRGEFCTKYGLCNDVNQKYDTFLTLGMLYGGKNAHLLPSEMLEFIEDNIDEKLLKEKWAFPYHLGSPHNMGKSTSVSPTNMKTPFEMLLDPFFAPLRVSMETVSSVCQTMPLYALPLTPEMESDYWEQAIPDVCLTTGE